MPGINAALISADRSLRGRSPAHRCWETPAAGGQKLATRQPRGATTTALEPPPAGRGCWVGGTASDRWWRTTAYEARRETAGNNNDYQLIGRQSRLTGFNERFIGRMASRHTNCDTEGLISDITARNNKNIRHLFASIKQQPVDTLEYRGNCRRCRHRIVL